MALKSSYHFLCVIYFSFVYVLGTIISLHFSFSLCYLSFIFSLLPLRYFSLISSSTFLFDFLHLYLFRQFFSDCLFCIPSTFNICSSYFVYIFSVHSLIGIELCHLNFSGYFFHISWSYLLNTAFYMSFIQVAFFHYISTIYLHMSPHLLERVTL